MAAKVPAIWLVLHFLVIYCSTQVDLYDYNYDVSDYFEAQSFSPERPPVDQWLRFNETKAKASGKVQMKIHEQIFQKNLPHCLKYQEDLKKRLMTDTQKAKRSVGYKRLREKQIEREHQQRIDRCHQDNRKQKQKFQSKSQLQKDIELTGTQTPTFILEVLSGLDDRDFQLRMQNQDIQRQNQDIQRQNQALKRQNQDILKRLERLERQVKRCKCRTNLKREKHINSFEDESETHS